MTNYRLGVRHKLTAAGLRKLQELGTLRGQVRAHLHLGSPAAQQEWVRFEADLPSPDQLREGLVPLSEDEIDHVVSKTRRLRDILEGQGLRPANA